MAEFISLKEGVSKTLKKGDTHHGAFSPTIALTVNHGERQVEAEHTLQEQTETRPY